MLIQIVTIKDVCEIKRKYYWLFSNYDVEVFVGLPEYIDKFVSDSHVSVSCDKLNELTVGERNLALSHYCMHKKFLLSEHDKCLVLEDDAFFNERELQCFLSQVESEQIQGFYLLGHSKTRRRFNWFENMKYPLESQRLVGGVCFGVTNNRYPGTLAYIISRCAAQKSVSRESLETVSDDWEQYRLFSEVFSARDRIVYEEFPVNANISSTGNVFFIHHNPFGKNFLREWGVVVKVWTKKLFRL